MELEMTGEITNRLEKGHKRKSPGYAGFLSIIYPGAGHIYIGCYKKGIFLMLIWALLIPLCFVGVGWVFAFPFGAYCAIDAFNKVQKMNRTAPFSQAKSERSRE